MPITPSRLEAMSHAALYAPTSDTENNVDSDSLSAYKGGGAHETNFLLVTAAEFLATAPEEVRPWIGYWMITCPLAGL